MAGETCSAKVDGSTAKRLRARVRRPQYELLTGLPYTRQLDFIPIRGAGPMVETSPPSKTFKMTRLIGGKLRALYDEEAQPCSSRMDDLLKILAAAESGTNTKEPEQRQRAKKKPRRSLHTPYEALFRRLRSAFQA